MDDKSLIDLQKVSKETVKIPVYSKIRIVNGRLIGVIDDFIEIPIEWLQDLEEKDKRKS